MITIIKMKKQVIRKKKSKYEAKKEKKIAKNMVLETNGSASDYQNVLHATNGKVIPSKDVLR